MSQPKIRTARLVPFGEADRSFDREFWRKVGPEGRFAAAWQMVVDAHLLRGKDASELRLQRSVAGFRPFPG